MLLEVLLFYTLVLQGYSVGDDITIRNRNIYYYADGGTFEVIGLTSEKTDCGDGVKIIIVDDRPPTDCAFVRKRVLVYPWRDSVSCKVPNRGTFHLNLMNVTGKENSTSSQYLILPHHDKDSEVPILSCWSRAGGLELKTGVRSGDEWCCSDALHGHCSHVLYRDPIDTVKCLNSTITTGYGFTVQYQVKLWPQDDILAKFQCGQFECEESSHFTEDCNFTRQDNGVVGWSLQITVPYLTAKIGNSSHCSAIFYYKSFLVDSTRTPLNLTNSSITVSPLSTTGYVLDTLDNPVCQGDGWPVPDSAYWRVFKNGVVGGEVVGKIITSRKVILKGGTQRMCVVTRGTETIQHIMMPVTVREYSKVYNGNHHMYYKEGDTSSCSVSGDWRPSLAGGEGYTYNFSWTTNGTELSTSVILKDGVRRWSVNITGEGVYQCSVTLTYTRAMIYGIVKPFSMTAETNVTPPWTPPFTPPLPSTTTRPKATSVRQVDPLYIGLITAISFIVLVIALVSFKVIRRNQAKVDQLDVKFALVEVKKKMGVNTLYSQRDEESAALHDIDTIVRQIEKRNLEFEQVIGQGQFGKVIKAKLRSYELEGSEMLVAVKTLTQSIISSQEDFLKEVTTMYMFNHVNVLKLLGICTDNTPYLIITEYMSNGDLKEYLMRVKLTMRDKISICYQVASGLEHISSHKIVHRDVAARNCLVGDDLLIKVADFGLSRNVASSEYYQKEGGQVPIRWMAPEAIKFGRYTTENDIWAFGVLVWEVFTDGEFPYNVYSNEDVLANVINGLRLPKPAFCCEDVSMLMNSCWEADQLDRPTFLHITSQLSLMLRNERSSWLFLTPESSNHCEAECPHDVCVGGENTPFITRNKYVKEPQILCETSL